MLESVSDHAYLATVKALVIVNHSAKVLPMLNCLDIEVSIPAFAITCFIHLARVCDAMDFYGLVHYIDIEWESAFHRGAVLFK